jgi:hypothetical protein
MRASGPATSPDCSGSRGGCKVGACRNWSGPRLGLVRMHHPKEDPQSFPAFEPWHIKPATAASSRRTDKPARRPAPRSARTEAAARPPDAPPVRRCHRLGHRDDAAHVRQVVAVHHAVQHHRETQPLDDRHHARLQLEGSRGRQEVVQLARRVLERDLDVVEPGGRSVRMSCATPSTKACESRPFRRCRRRQLMHDCSDGPHARVDFSRRARRPRSPQSRQFSPMRAGCRGPTVVCPHDDRRPRCHAT